MLVNAYNFSISVIYTTGHASRHLKLYGLLDFTLCSRMTTTITNELHKRLVNCEFLELHYRTHDYTIFGVIQ